METALVMLTLMPFLSLGAFTILTTRLIDTKNDNWMAKQVFPLFILFFSISIQIRLLEHKWLLSR